MPMITEKHQVDRAVGMECDACGKVDRELFNDFSVRHSLGYDSAADGCAAEAAICDDCLTELLLAHVPGAVFRDGSGKAVPKEEIAAALADKRARSLARRGDNVG